MKGAINALNQRDGCGRIYCYQDRTTYYFDFSNFLIGRNGLSLKGGDVVGFEYFGLKTVNHLPVAERISLIEEQSLYRGLYLYTLKRFSRSWYFYIYPLLVCINPYNQLGTKIVVPIIYFIFSPALIASLQFDRIKRENKDWIS